MAQVGAAALPVMVALILFFGAVKGVPVFDTYLSGAMEFGPDSPTGKMASVLSSSTETTFYAVAVYFGACGYKRLRYTIPAALLGDATALLFSILTVRLLG